VFGTSFGEAEARLSKSLGPPRITAETYLVSPRSGSNTKIRDAVLDLKLLDRIDRRGLERWRPVLKATFPLDPVNLSKVFDAWSTPVPTAVPVANSPDDLVAWLRQAAPDVTSVPVTKSRAGAVLSDCLVEIADLTFDGVPARTLAVEMSDPERLWTVVQDLGIDRLENTNYVRALKRFIATHVTIKA
jgi:exopolyphosphatase/guanosine-5'-triphosphate,3'-diphosphate pyrophosphatase